MRDFAETQVRLVAAVRSRLAAAAGGHRREVGPGRERSRRSSSCSKVDPRSGTKKIIDHKKLLIVAHYILQICLTKVSNDTDILKMTYDVF